MGRVLQSEVTHKTTSIVVKQYSFLESPFKDKEQPTSFQKSVEMKNQSDELKILKEETHGPEHGIRG